MRLGYDTWPVPVKRHTCCCRKSGRRLGLPESDSPYRLADSLTDYPVVPAAQHHTKRRSTVCRFLVLAVTLGRRLLREYGGRSLFYDEADVLSNVR